MSAAARRAWLLAGLLALGVLVTDQVAKAIVEGQITLGEQIEVLGPLEFTLTHNRGVAFGLAGGALLGRLLRPLITVVRHGVNRKGSETVVEVPKEQRTSPDDAIRLQKVLGKGLAPEAAAPPPKRKDD